MARTSLSALSDRPAMLASLLFAQPCDKAVGGAIELRGFMA
jgi:hypothetical protein